MRKFEKDEIVLNYHAEIISKDTHDMMMETSDDDDRRSDYIFAMPGGVFLDGSSENCNCHPHARIMGRLVNFAQKTTPECNLTPRYFEFRDQNREIFKTVLFVAARDIEIFQELMFDYGDVNCAEMFTT